MKNRIITENQLDEWVRGNSREAQGVIVEFVWRLVAASSPKPKFRRFPLGDSIGQHGPDGDLDTDFDFDPFVPEGRSFWEIGTGVKAGDKATTDYNGLTNAIPDDVRHESTFIFITPLSGRRDWEYTWKEDAQAKWLEERRQRNDWRDVRVIDGSGLIDWLHSFPSVELWLAEKMDFPVNQIQTPEQRWSELRTIGDPPPLIPELFLTNRDAACQKLKDIFSKTTLQLKLDTRFIDQVPDFVSAHVASMDEDSRVDAFGRCLIISGVDGWNAITTLRESHVLVADFYIDDTDSTGSRLLEKARRAGHAVIFGGMPGGIPHPNRVGIPNPKSYQMEKVLRKAGYNGERARILSKKSDGNLGSLLRCLQNLSLMPEWAKGTDAADLAIAELLGAWNEQSEADRAVVEKLSKKDFGEWIGKMREITLRPGTPLIQRDGIWKMVARYEGWYILGTRIFDEHLDRLKEAAVNVLREKDPQFELKSDERYAAQIHGKVLPHSGLLRKGMAESLALLGSHPKALASCSFGKADTTAVLAVREILADADWILWAGLNHLLPLFAEAAPREFLDAVENALKCAPCPFKTLFDQEGTGITGSNYITGLLWGLETLAWDGNYLTRVVIILGELAAMDPGGNWANRPANSLSTILLPWFPQTCATIPKRKIAVESLIKELPDVAWKLLLHLLPSFQQLTFNSHKPIWREIIPEDWTDGATRKEYWEQITAYADMSIKVAGNNLPKIIDLIDRLGDLPPPARDQLLTYLNSDSVVAMPQSERTRLWDELTDFVTKHRKFANAKWSLKPEVVNEIDKVAQRMVPEDSFYRYQRLFNKHDSDLYEEKGNFEELRKKVESQRQNAINEVFGAGGLKAVLDFAKEVKTPRHVGICFGFAASDECDSVVLPGLLESNTGPLAQFAGGFVWGRFMTQKWQWVDSKDTSQWTPSQKGMFLALLPFSHETWERASQLLGNDESPYWTKSFVNPYEAEGHLEFAVDRLIYHGRLNAAISCIEKMIYDKQPQANKVAVRVLRTVMNSGKITKLDDVNAIKVIIKSLQDSSDTNLDELIQVEWAFLPLLDRLHGSYPETIEKRLSESPSFFCDIIRVVYPGENEKILEDEPSELQENIVLNAFRLLHRWRTPPGSQKDGSFDGDLLLSWLEEVKTSCAESGHLNVAMVMIGQVLIYTPPDPDGLWLNHSVAKALNAKDADEMRDGFQTELINSRGTHGWTAGREELEIAEKYQSQAEEIEANGYHRLAGTLRDLVAFYERDAERQVSRDFT